MKKYFLLLFAGIMFGCGDGGAGYYITTPSGGNPGGFKPGDKPVISNMRIAPSSAALNSNGGVAEALITVDFADSEGNLSTFDLVSIDAGGTQSPVTTAPAGTTQTKGTLYCALYVNTDTVRTEKYGVSVTDSNGNKSNLLTASFTVY